MDLGGPVVEQLAAAHLVNALAEPLPARLAALRDNRDALLDLIAGHLPDWQSERPDGGLSVWCRLPAPISTALAVVAPDFGIRLAAGPRFGIGGAFEHYLRVPFTLPAGAAGNRRAGPAFRPGQAGGVPAAAAQPRTPPAQPSPDRAPARGHVTLPMRKCLAPRFRRRQAFCVSQHLRVAGSEAGAG